MSISGKLYFVFFEKKSEHYGFIKIVMTNREEGFTYLLHKTFSQQQIFSWQFPFRIILYRRHCHFMWLLVYIVLSEIVKSKIMN